MKIKKRLSKGIKKTLWIGSLITAFVAYIIFQEYSAIFPFYMLITLSFLSCLLFHICSREVRYTLHANKLIMDISESVSIMIGIENRFYYPFKKMELEMIVHNSFLSEDEIQMAEIKINGKKKENNSFDFQSKHVGFVKIKISKIYMYDFFGIFNCCKKRCSEELELIVMPKYEDTHFLLSDLQIQPICVENIVKYISGEDENRNQFEIRTFQDGDKLNRIHWKLSSKSEKLMILEEKEQKYSDIFVYIDLSNALNINKILNSAFSVGNEIIEEKHDFYYLWFDVETMKFEKRHIKTLDEIDETICEVMNVLRFDMTPDIKDIVKILQIENHTYNTFRMNLNL